MAGHRLARDSAQIREAWTAARSLRQFCRLMGFTYNAAAAERLVESAGLAYPAPHWGSQQVDCAARLRAVMTGESAAGGMVSPTVEMPGDEELLALLEAKGYLLQKHASPTDRQARLETKTFDGTDFTVGVVSDTHLCSKYQQLTHLETAYDYFASHGIDHVLHAGDLTAGNGHVYRGQIYELAVIGADAQADYVRTSYPHRDGITTHVIAGNHDLSWVTSDGYDIVKQVAKDRDDLDYIGWYSADVFMHGVRINLHHGEGGVSYARSYKLQRYIEQIAPEEKPNVLIEGHFHVTCVLEMYRNVNARMAGCFESQTPFLRRKKLYPEIGFYVLTMRGNAQGLVKVSAEFVPFYVPIAEDY